ncbi:hypothetical protein Tco_0420487 [Tanacetum coccineum]
MGKNDISYFSSFLQDGAAYRISNFMCVPTSNYQQTLETETTLRFGKYTKFESIPSNSFPKHYFNFVSYNQLDSKIYWPSTTTMQKRSTLTDYIGCLTRVRNVRKFESAGTNQIVIQKMDIDNLNGDVVELALWNEMAKISTRMNSRRYPNPLSLLLALAKFWNMEIGIMNPVASAHEKSYTYNSLEQPWWQSKQTTGSCESSKIHTGTPIPATTSQLIAGTTMTTTPTPLTTPTSSPSMDTPKPETPSQHIPETSVPASNNPSINLPETTLPSQPMDKKEPENSKATSEESTKPLKRTLFPEDPPEHKKNKTD